MSKELIDLAAAARDEAERLEKQHLGDSGFTAHTMRCQTLYLKLRERVFEKRVADTLAKKCDELQAEIQKLRAENKKMRDDLEEEFGW